MHMNNMAHCARQESYYVAPHGQLVDAILGLWSKFALDLRALALCRFALGLSSALEVIELFQHREAFLGDSGVCPSKNAKGQQAFDLYLAARGGVALTIVSLLNFLVSLAFAVGLWTRCSNFAVWLLALSQQHRLGGCADYGGDQLRSQLMFWALFVPLGAVWSVDAFGEQVAGLKSLWSPELWRIKTDGSIDEQADIIGCAIELEANSNDQPETTEIRLPTFRSRSHNDGWSQGLPSACDPSSDDERRAPDSQIARSAPLSAFLIVIQLASMYSYTASTKIGESWSNGTAVQKVLHLPQYSRQPVAGILSAMPTLCHLLSIFTLWVEKFGWWLAFCPSQLCRLLCLLMFGGLHFGLNMSLRVGNFQLFALSAWLIVTPPRLLDLIERFVLLGLAERFRLASLKLQIPGLAVQQGCTRLEQSAHGQSRRCLAGKFLTAVAFYLMYASIVEGCSKRGSEKCLFARFGGVGSNTRDILLQLGLIQRWNMFSPDVPTHTLRIGVFGVVASPGCDIGRPKFWEACRYVELWDDKGVPTLSQPIVDTNTWGTMRPPRKTSVDFATNRWRKLMENEEHSKGLGSFLCAQWRFRRPATERLLGVWWVRARSRLPNGDELFTGAWRHWCSLDAKQLMMQLPRKQWIAK